MIYLELFLTFFKIGAFTFGGGYAMLPLIQSETIAAGWIDGERLLNFVAVAESTPGPFAINIATYIGAETGGVLGALCATLGVVLPSFIIILIVAKCYMAFRRSRVVEGIMTGLRPTVVGLIGCAAVTMAMTVFFPAGLSVSVFSSASGFCLSALVRRLLVSFVLFGFLEDARLLKNLLETFMLSPFIQTVLIPPLLRRPCPSR